MNKYYPRIQVLRGVLFLLILAFHCGAPFVSFGWGGVEAFFVISAFFLVKKYWGTGTLDVKKQFAHRIIRLYPPYIVVLIVAALYALLTKVIPFDFVTHLLSCQNFQWMITRYSSPMQPMTAHTWTLSIEVWSGLVWLLLLRYLDQKHFKNSMYMMLFIGVLYRTLSIYLGCDIYMVSLCPVAHFDAFACGSLLAIECKNEKLNKSIGIMSAIGLVGIVACVCVIAINNDVSIWQGYLLLSSSKNYLNNLFTGNIYLYISMMITGLVGLIYIRDSERSEQEVGKIIRLFVIMGDNSYVLYLFHWLILKIVMRLMQQWIISLPVTLIASIIATYIFNKIYIRILEKLHGGMKHDSTV
ncbi:acyltransferase family protein [Butyrivibrio sp. XPD2002]|uniref:acyltransferase family protein n=1 Tax=Butyrivibrio sp. XPD2002 TaxID=1280665 RepID=UPI00041BBA6C|nr:acyltransferase [Butyrivibrio sp. XPD2002]